MRSISKPMSYGGKKQKRREFFNFLRFSTQTRGRTGMEVNPLVFETSASTDSAIWACMRYELFLFCGCKGTTFFHTSKLFHNFSSKKVIITSFITNILVKIKINSNLAETLKPNFIMTNSNNYCVIMAGGIGSRFWPYSRKNKPKQFLDFFGTGQTLLQLTFNRYSNIVPKENVFVITNVQYENLVKEQLPELEDSRILLEPTRRNTAPCIAWASSHIQQLNPNANIIVAPADHLILKENEFIEAITKGLEFVAQSPQLLTLGIKPNRPETGYGYIQIADEKQGDFYKVKTFIEKPQLEFAQVFVESDEFYWNSGIFLWNVNTILNAFNTYMLEICPKVMTGGKDFDSCPNISIDYAIMEQGDYLNVQLCDFGWADLGTWGSLHEASPKDHHKNVTINGNTLLYDCENNIIAMPKDKLIVLQGLNDYLIADTDNVLLICRKDDESTIRRYVTDVQIKLGEEFV